MPAWKKTGYVVNLAQIKAKGYADTYLAHGEPIHVIGVAFSKAARNVVGFEVETDPPWPVQPFPA